MDLIYTDLDGTLLDADTYSWEAARPAIDRLKDLRVPWIFVSSKTRAEIEFWRRGLGNDHPFIVENGGAAFIPVGYFPAPTPSTHHRDCYEVMEWGTPYTSLVDDLRAASEITDCRVRGFYDMTPEEVAAACDLPIEQALLAKQREYDEPFFVLDSDRVDALTAAIVDRGRHWTRGGRFWHIVGANNKALAVEALTELYEQRLGPVRTIGLGDGLNDALFLERVSVPVIIRSPHAPELQARVPRGVVTEHAGPQGWNTAVLSLIGD